VSDFDFSGTHVIADIVGIDPVTIRDNHTILRGMDEGLGRSGATLCGLQVRQFDPVGLTVVYLLSESHASVHTYPERNALFFDAFTCGTVCDPKAFLDALVAALGPCDVRVKVFRRGSDIQAFATADHTDPLGHTSHATSLALPVH
jgi:S-adenosylmethionine decarboxylase